ncbi:MAG TPA: TetR/AcrR family transcriptional regulator [Terriglobales bacterium]|nr:TetR/AcrR family transcriptional regulator [Terriglobales bacterium]HVN19702.1 TetR/AcrR family transcriptional regulator [Dongiaceae bacterium]
MPQSYARAATESNGINGRRAPGRPRSEHSRKAILRSTLKLLRQQGGFHDLSIEAVADDANVSKATIYRWWPTKAALVVDAFAASADEELRFQDTGSLHRDISQQMHRVVRIFRSPRGKILSALLAGGQSDPELLEAFRDRFLWPRRREAYKTLERGIDRGELAPDTDLDVLLDSLYGPIYMRFLIRHKELTDDFADQLCGLMLRSCASKA